MHPLMLARAALLRYFLHYSVMSVMIKSYFTSKREKIKFEGGEARFQSPSSECSNWSDLQIIGK